MAVLKNRIINSQIELGSAGSFAASVMWAIYWSKTRQLAKNRLLFIGPTFVDINKENVFFFPTNSSFATGPMS